jgi:Catalase
MQGFGIHTFRFVNDEGQSTFVKFHWKPKQGVQSTIWDEAVKIAGADPDFHRRDLFDAIARGDYPEWEFGIQPFDEAFAAKFPMTCLTPPRSFPRRSSPTVGTPGIKVSFFTPQQISSEIQSRAAIKSRLRSMASDDAASRTPVLHAGMPRCALESDAARREKRGPPRRFPGSSWRNRNSAHRSYPHEARPKARDSARRLVRVQHSRACSKASRH